MADRESVVNHGNWNINNLFILGACHTPEFDELMVDLRLAEKAFAECTQPVGRLPMPYLGNLSSVQIQNDLNRKKQKVIEYVQKHPDIVVLGSR